MGNAAAAPNYSQPQPSRLQPTQFQQGRILQKSARQLPMARQLTAPKGGSSYIYSFEPPPPERLFFHLESDAAFRERMRQEARSRKERGRVEFPQDIVLTDQKYYGRRWPKMVKVVEPNFVCYRRPYFAQVNFERYGWELGLLQPAICAGKFYWDVFFLPYHMGTDPFRRYECNAGYCLPGDPVPLYLYPPNFNISGAAAQAGALGLGFLAFP